VCPRRYFWIDLIVVVGVAEVNSILKGWDPMGSVDLSESHVASSFDVS
jgi:hypothetical protein